MVLRRVMSDWLIALADWARSLAVALDRAAELSQLAADPVMADLVERYPGAPAHWLAFMAERMAAEAELETAGGPPDQAASSQDEPRRTAPSQPRETVASQKTARPSGEGARPATSVRPRSRPALSEVPSLADLASRSTEVWSPPRARPRSPSRPVFAPLAVAPPAITPSSVGLVLSLTPSQDETRSARPSRAVLKPRPSAASAPLAACQVTNTDTLAKAPADAPSGRARAAVPGSRSQTASFDSASGPALHTSRFEASEPEPRGQAAPTTHASALHPVPLASSPHEDLSHPAPAPAPAPAPPSAKIHGVETVQERGKAPPAASSQTAVETGPVSRSSREPSFWTHPLSRRVMETVVTSLRREPRGRTKPAQGPVDPMAAPVRASPVHEAPRSSAQPTSRSTETPRAWRQGGRRLAQVAEPAADTEAPRAVEAWSPPRREQRAARGWTQEAFSAPGLADFQDGASAPRSPRRREVAEHVASVSADDHWPALPPKAFVATPTAEPPAPRWRQLAADQEEGRWNA